MNRLPKLTPLCTPLHEADVDEAPCCVSAAIASWISLTARATLWWEVVGRRQPPQRTSRTPVGRICSSHRGASDVRRSQDGGRLRKDRQSARGRTAGKTLGADPIIVRRRNASPLRMVCFREPARYRQTTAIGSDAERHLRPGNPHNRTVRCRPRRCRAATRAHLGRSSPCRMG